MHCFKNSQLYITCIGPTADKPVQKAVVKTKTLCLQFILMDFVNFALERVHILVVAVSRPNPAASKLLIKAANTVLFVRVPPDM